MPMLTQMRFWLVFCLLTNLTFLGCVKSATYSLSGDQDKRARMRNIGDGICLQLSSDLMWQIEKNGPFLVWEEAASYADDLQLGGYSDWRLPTYEELYILHDIFEFQDNGDCQMNRKGSFWCGNDKHDARVGTWESYPLCGGDEYRFIDKKSKKGFVRAVRP